MTRAALAAARRPAEETHALTVGNLVKEDTYLVIPIAAAIAFDPAVIDACLVLACLADGATRHVILVRRVRAIEGLRAFPLASERARAVRAASLVVGVVT